MRTLVVLLGVTMVAVGVVALFFEGIPYGTERTEVQLGPVQIEAEKRRVIPLSPAAGGIVLAGGVVLVAVGLSRMR